MKPSGESPAPASAEFSVLDAPVRAFEAALHEAPRGDPVADDQWFAETLVAGVERIFVRYLH